MTYALRGGLEPSTAVQPATPVLLARLLNPPASVVFQDRSALATSLCIQQPLTFRASEAGSWIRGLSSAWARRTRLEVYGSFDAVTFNLGIMAGAWVASRPGATNRRMDRP